MITNIKRVRPISAASNQRLLRKSQMANHRPRDIPWINACNDNKYSDENSPVCSHSRCQNIARELS